MNAAIVGYGYWGKIVRKYIDNDSRFNLIKICSNHIPAGDNSLYTNCITDILNDNSIDSVFVCSPTNTHFEMCKMLLLHNKHVFCEKPTTYTSSELDILLQTADSRKKIIFTDYIYTVSKSVKKIKDLLPKLGDILVFEGEIRQFGNFYPSDTVEEIIGVHLISVLVYLFPQVNIKIYVRNNTNELEAFNKNVHMVTNKNMDVYLTYSLINPSKVRTIKIYGTAGSVLCDMMDPAASVRLLNYKSLSSHTMSKTDEKAWKFDESNNLVHALDMFYNITLSGDNRENLNIAKKVIQIMEQIKRS